MSNVMLWGRPAAAPSPAWTPAQIAGALYLDPRSLTAMSSVSAWADSAGNYPSFVQPTSSLQPVALAASGGNPGMVQFDSLGDVVVADLGIETNATAYTAIALHYEIGVALLSTVLSASVDTGVYGGVQIGYTSTSSVIGANNAGDSGGVGVDVGAAYPGTWMVTTVTSDGSGDVAVRSQAAGTEGAVSTSSGTIGYLRYPSTKLMVGQYYWGGFSYSGNIGGIVWVPEVLDETAIAQTENYLKALVPGF